MILIFLAMLSTQILEIALSYYNDDFYRPVPGGVKIASGDYIATSSYVVEDTSTGKRYLLAIYHLLEASGTGTIYQPSTSSDYYLIGSMSWYSTYADAALIEANKELSVEWDPRIRLPSGSFIQLSGKVSFWDLEQYYQDTVEIIGTASGLQYSYIYDWRLEVLLINPYTNSSLLVKFVVVLQHNITRPGDSGAPAWIPSWGGNYLLGHVIGRLLDENRTVIASVTSVEEYLLVTPVVGG